MKIVIICMAILAITQIQPQNPPAGARLLTCD